MPPHPPPPPSPRLLPLLSFLLLLPGIYLFSSGFFLSKLSLPAASSCFDTIPSLHNHIFSAASSPPSSYTNHLLHTGLLAPSPSAPSCVRSPPLIDHLNLLIVDALRFDFARSRLPSLSSSYPPRAPPGASTLLFKFLADPPTVTTQRLKGLTTGGLPTFADVSSTFTTAALEEDTWLRQLRDDADLPSPRAGFAGDDTWGEPRPLRL